MTPEDEKLKTLVERYLAKHGGKRGSLWTLARQCYSVGYQSRKQSERKGKWIDYSEDGYVECPFCHSATNCDDNIEELHFCFSCGARLEVQDA